MGFRFRKSFKIAPGVRINLSKSGISTSIGPTGAKVNIGPNGVRATTSIPGTGMSYSTKLSGSKGKSKMSVCPFCGHKMRKQWDKCPKCHNELRNENTESGIEETNFSNQKVAASSGCLLPILLTIFLLATITLI